jgi:S-DNA-T family DNA segregation ATPase FtsK/SpoIIIE
MITEFAIATGIVYGFNYFKNPATKIKKDFNRVMSNNNLDYKIIKILDKNYGHSLIINLGYNGYEKLEGTKDMLETSLGYMVYIEQNKNLKTATIDMIRPISNIKFEPVKIQPYELYIGKSFTQRTIISNMNKFPHALVSGQTGCGKTEEMNYLN